MGDLALEESYWRQKAGYEWFENGDKNTNFFSKCSERKKTKDEGKYDQDHQGDCMEISDAAIVFYQNQFE